MKSLFELGSNYSAQELSYRKILGQLSDKGNAATIKHYLDLLDKAGIMCGLQKFDNKILKTKASSPRLLVYDQALMTANNKSLQTLLNDPSSKGHLIESIVGAALLRWSKLEDFDLYWWRDGNYEVDFIAQQDENIIAIEVKSGRIKTSGLLEFRKRYKNALPLVVGTRNLNLETFLEHKKPLFKT
ncbi:MAG: DUF4143 domain-containing protein [Clostridia bacterium]|nr:DUF4143 domain-containing protein [Clostridia bacterium]